MKIRTHAPAKQNRPATIAAAAQPSHRYQTRSFPQPNPTTGQPTVQARQQPADMGQLLNIPLVSPERSAEAAPTVQAKFTIGQPNDKYEQEADRTAAQVMATPDTAVQREEMPEEEKDIQAKPQLQREAMPEEEDELQRKPQLQRETMPEEEEELQKKPQLQREAISEEEEETLQAKPHIQAKDGSLAAPANFDRQLAQHKGSGQPLSDETRAFMEPRFGADFSNVRVHETPDLASAIQAQAFTHGQDIYFNSGKYNPGSSTGKELLAHELTHVVQQNQTLPRKSKGLLGNSSVGQIQREFAVQPPEGVADQPELTHERVARAIRYNRASYEADSTRLIQDVVGAQPTGEFDETTVRLVAQMQEEFGLIADGKVGPNTYDLLIEELSAEGASSDNPLTMFQLVGPEPLRFFRNSPTTGTIGSRFYIKIRFDPRCDSQDWEYRQYIAGSVDLHDVSGTTVNLNNRFSIPGGGLPTSLSEDGDTAIPAGTAGHHYGHRDYAPNPSDDRDRYLPSRANGYIYEGHDFPELGPIPAAPGDSGDRYDWTMRFRGVIRRKGNGVVQEKYWVVRGTVIIP